jgi:hypothetical protein
MVRMRFGRWLMRGTVVSACAWPVWAGAEGLQGLGLEPGASALRGRIGLTVDADLQGTNRLQGVQMLGDYYFAFTDPATASTAAAAAPSGLRATSGLLLRGASGGLVLPGRQAGVLSVGRGNTGLVDAGADGLNQATPYVGIGYSTSFAHNRWSVSADLGLVSRASAQGLRLSRADGIGQSLDSFLRDPQMSPMLQLGLTYSF